MDINSNNINKTNLSSKYLFSFVTQWQSRHKAAILISDQI